MEFIPKESKRTTENLNPGDVILIHNLPYMVVNINFFKASDADICISPSNAEFIVSLLDGKMAYIYKGSSNFKPIKVELHEI